MGKCKDLKTNCKKSDVKLKKSPSEQMVMQYVVVPVREPLSNIPGAKFIKDSFINHRLEYTGNSLNDLKVNIPPKFKELSEEVAILQGQTHGGSEKYKNHGNQNPISCVISIVTKDVRPVNSWLRATLENILTLGDSIYDELKTKNPSAKSITSVDMDKYKLQIETKKLIVGVEIMTLSGTIYSKEPSILSLKVALEQFFNHYNAGVMETKALVVAVWKDGDVFYMFQPYQCDNTGKRIMEEKKPEVKAGDDKKSGGKKKEKKEKKVSKELEPDKKTVAGKCCLVRLSNLTALTSMISNNTDRTNRNDHFIIRQVTFVDDIPGAEIWHDFIPGDVGKSWILKGTLSSDNEMFEDTSRGKQGMAIPLMALIFAKQFPPAEWTKNLVDEVVIEGDSYFNFCTYNLESEEEISLTSVSMLKNKLHARKRRVQFDIEDSTIAGEIPARTLDKSSNLSLEDGIFKFFNEYQCTFGIVQIDDYSIAIWKSQDETKGDAILFAYYLFDASPKFLLSDNGIKKETDEEPLASVLRFLNLTDLVEYIKRNIPTGGTVDFNTRKGTEYLLHNVNVLSIGKEMNEEELEADKPSLEKPDLKNYKDIGGGLACLQGNFSQTDATIFDDKTRDKQQSANAFAALSMTKMCNPHLWYPEIIDNILRMGNKITVSNLDNLPQPEEEEEHEEPLRTFLLPNEITPEFYVGVSRVAVNLEEEAATGLVSDLEKTFEAYFEDNNMGVLYQGNVVIPIWKEREVYFMMDPRGSNQKGQSSGASVFWSMSVPDLCSHLKKLLNAEGQFTIDGFSIENLEKTESEFPYIPKAPDFKEESEGVFVIRRTEENSESESKNPNLSVTTSLIGLLFSKIYKPSQFSLLIFNEMVTLGMKYFENCNLSGDCRLHVNNVSTNLHFTNQHFQFTVHDCVLVGRINSNKSSVPNLEQGLQKYFAENTSGILIIDGRNHLAIFKDDGLYYCVVPDNEILQVANIQLLNNEILKRFSEAVDFEISKVDIVTLLDVGQPECFKNSIIEELSLPPLNAFKQLKNPTEAVLVGSINQNSKNIPAALRGRQTAAACVVALAMSILKSPITWTKKTVDEILIASLQLQLESMERLKKDKIKPSETVRIFEIGSNILAVDVESVPSVSGQVKIRPPPPVEDKHTTKDKKGKKGDKKGKSDKKEKSDKPEKPDKKGKKGKKSKDETPQPVVKVEPIILLKEGLETFLQNNSSGILVAGRSVCAIWKDFQVYFVYQPFCRDTNQVVGSTYVKWFACLQPLVTEIECNLNEKEIYEKYQIHRTIVNTKTIKTFPHPPGFEIYLKNNMSPLAPSALKKIPILSVHPKTFYHQMNKQIYVLAEDICLSSQAFSTKSRNLISTGIATVVLTISQLHPPEMWTPEILSAILDYGEILHFESAEILQSANRNLQPTEICSNFVIANFEAIISVNRQPITGIWQHNDLLQSLSHFCHKFGMGILSIADVSYAVIERNKLCYLFHPNILGSLIDQTFEYGACMLQFSNVTKMVEWFFDNFRYSKLLPYTLREVKIIDLRFFSHKVVPSD